MIPGFLIDEFYKVIGDLSLIRRIFDLFFHLGNHFGNLDVRAAVLGTFERPMPAAIAE